MRPPRAAEDAASAPGDTLFVLGGALGDVVLRLPALRALGPARVLAPRAWGTLLREAGLASWGDRLDDPRFLDLWRPDREGLPEGLRGLRRVVLTVRDEVLRAGLERRVPELLALDPEPSSGEHQAIAFLRQLGQGPELPEAIDVPLLPVPEAWTRRSEAVFGGPIDALLLPGSGGLAKCWPRESFAWLARALAQQGWAVLVVLGPDELERGWSAAGFDAPVLLAPELRETAALTARARLVVGNDAGTTHLAAAVGARVVALFSTTDPARWRPMGPHARVVRASPGQVLAPELVLDEVLAHSSTRQSLVQPSGKGSGSGSFGGMARK